LFDSHSGNKNKENKQKKKKKKKKITKMFEGIVASLMNMYLSEYIDEVDYNNLKIGIFSGKFRATFLNKIKTTKTTRI
jgi:hypothetical protein